MTPLEFLYEEWPELAAFAYGSYLEHGRGTVVIGRAKDLADECDPDALKPVCPITELIELRGHVRTYNPRREAVFAVTGGQVCLVHKVSASSIYTPPTLHAQSLEGQWGIVCACYRGEATPRERAFELYSVLSFRRSERKRRQWR